MSEQIDKMSEDELQDLVASSDTGGRSPSASIKKLITITAIAWSLFHLYIAGGMYGFESLLKSMGFNIATTMSIDKAKYIHLAFALFLAFLSYPAFPKSPKNRIPVVDWTLAILGAFLTLYLVVYFKDVAGRAGNPNNVDIIMGSIGILILLEAARRSLGLPLVIIAIVFLIFNFLGPYLPQSISHNGNTLGKVIDKQWITQDGVFGKAIGVSTQFVFLFVLFGALLDKAGAGNYFIKTAFSLLGHLRGGPAKAAVIASGLTGLISGSSIANVVTTGTFTIPMMKKVGFSAEKSGAVEVASSVNGQIMPPVMGAAAFLMIEYVGIEYTDIVKSAIIPAVISYIALVYIVHLEAIKLGMEGFEQYRQPPKAMIRIMRGIIILSGVIILSFLIHIVFGTVKKYTGDYMPYVVSGLIIISYLSIAWWCAKFPTLELDDPNAPVTKLPPVKETVNSGLHFILPVIVLIYCLMVEKKSPGKSAFYGTMVLIFILFTQKAVFAFFRGELKLAEQLKSGVKDIFDGFEIGAKNMIGIGIATATAGIIVGVVALTNIGAPLANIVEALSGGNILVMLIMVGILSLILGMGLPTTANYIIVQALLAGVIVEVGRRNGLVVPLIAVHLFVFYFGIMADVTPPVGLASFAAAAISGGDPIKTGFIAFFYSLRTAILPFLFIYNTDLLLIDVGWLEGITVFIISTVAILVFTAATQKYFFDKCNWLEVGLLILIAFTLFRPGYFMEKLSPSYNESSPSTFIVDLGKAPEGREIQIKVNGESDIGDPISFYAFLPIEGKTTKERLENMGLELSMEDNKLIIKTVVGSKSAEKAKLESFQEIIEIKIPKSSYIPKQLLFIPALILLVLIAMNQIRRKKKREVGVNNSVTA